MASQLVSGGREDKKEEKKREADGHTHGIHKFLCPRSSNGAEILDEMLL
jgi:hypothetical protein